MMTIGEVIQVANPDATQTDMENIVWSRTPYPFDKLSVKELYKESARFFRAKNNGIRLCDFCDNAAMIGDIVCERCDSLLKNGALAER